MISVYNVKQLANLKSLLIKNAPLEIVCEGINALNLIPQIRVFRKELLWCPRKPLKHAVMHRCAVKFLKCELTLRRSSLNIKQPWKLLPRNSILFSFLSVGVEC